MVGVRPRPSGAPLLLDPCGEASCWLSSAATSDFKSGLLGVVDAVAVENRPLESPLLLTEPARDAVSDAEGVGLLCRSFLLSGSISRDMPGRPLRPDATVSPTVSSLFFLYAADPVPLSAVCLNQEGSLAPSDAAISSLLGSDFSAGALRFSESPVAAYIDVGLLPPLESGLLCQERVPLRARLVALGDGCVLRSGACAGVDEEDDAELRTLLKPVKTGTSRVGDGGPGGAIDWSIAEKDEVGGVSDGGDVNASDAMDDLKLGESLVDAGLSGDIDRARSVQPVFCQ